MVSCSSAQLTASVASMPGASAAIGSAATDTTCTMYGYSESGTRCRLCRSAANRWAATDRSGSIMRSLYVETTLRRWGSGSALRQRDARVVIADDVGELVVAPVVLGLLDPVLVGRDEVPPDVAGAVERRAADQHDVGICVGVEHR